MTTPELEALYFQTDLEFRYVWQNILQIQALRRDKIPDETIWAWFREFLRLGWKQADFDRALQNVKSAKIYGAIDFRNFLEAEPLYTAAEVELKVRERVNQTIRRGEHILKNAKLEINIKGSLETTENDLEAIRAAIMSRVRVYYSEASERQAADLITEFFAYVKEQGGFKNEINESLT